MSRIGIIGCGNIAPLYARTLNELGWVEIAAFADGLPDRAERFAAKYGGAAVRPCRSTRCWPTARSKPS
jgi:predicted dehydrogenase